MDLSFSAAMAFPLSTLVSHQLVETLRLKLGAAKTLRIPIRGCTVVGPTRSRDTRSESPAIGAASLRSPLKMPAEAIKKELREGCAFKVGYGLVAMLSKAVPRESKTRLKTTRSLYLVLEIARLSASLCKQVSKCRDSDHGTMGHAYTLAMWSSLERLWRALVRCRINRRACTRKSLSAYLLCPGNCVTDQLNASGLYMPVKSAMLQRNASG